MQIPKVLSDLITNKYVLYLVAGIAFFNVFGYIALGNVNAIIFFILIGYITSFFSKNMIIILLVSMLFTNFLIVGMNVKEGLENASDDKKKTDLMITPLDNVDDKDDYTAEEFQTQKEPLEYSNVDFSDNKKKGKPSVARSDHGTNVENAYDTLNKIVTGPEFSKMSDDTKKLITQQQKLAESLEKFTPIIDVIKPFLEKAQGLLGNTKIEEGSDMFGSQP
jgi:hypothetical protein